MVQMTHSLLLKLAKLYSNAALTVDAVTVHHPPRQALRGVVRVAQGRVSPQSAHAAATGVAPFGHCFSIAPRALGAPMRAGDAAARTVRCAYGAPRALGAVDSGTSGSGA